MAQREAHLAQVECDRRTALRQAEIRKEADAVLLQSGLPVPDPGAAVQALAPGLPMQAASSLLQALPPQLAESFKGWWASLSVDQQAVAQPAQGAVHTRPPDARAGLGMDDSSEFEEEEETLALQGVAAVELAPNGETDAAFCPFRRARRPRSDPYPQLGQSLVEAAGLCGLGDRAVVGAAVVLQVKRCCEPSNACGHVSSGYVGLPGCIWRLLDIAPTCIPGDARMAAAFCCVPCGKAGNVCICLIFGR